MKKIEKGKVLWESVVGSHIWSMERVDSDVDVFKGYIVPTTDVLSGICRQNSHFTAGDRDESRHEIGVCVNQLIKGNINFIIGVCSPLLICSKKKFSCDKNKYKDELNEIVKDNLSKNSYGSIYGFAQHNYQKYIIKRNEINNEKRINNILRTLNFGITLMEKGKIEFKPYYGIVNEIEPMIKEFKNATDNSNLPSKIDEEPFRNWLMNLRLDELNGRLEV